LITLQAPAQNQYEDHWQKRKKKESSDSYSVAIKLHTLDVQIFDCFCIQICPKVYSYLMWRKRKEKRK